MTVKARQIAPLPMAPRRAALAALAALAAADAMLHRPRRALRPTWLRGSAWPG